MRIRQYPGPGVRPAQVADQEVWWPRGVFTVLSEVAFVTAILYYFGWARTEANFGYFGIDVSWLGLSTTDYVLRSIGSIFWPSIYACLIVTALTYLHAVGRRCLCVQGR